MASGSSPARGLPHSSALLANETPGPGKLAQSQSNLSTRGGGMPACTAESLSIAVRDRSRECPHLTNGRERVVPAPTPGWIEEKASLFSKGSAASSTGRIRRERGNLGKSDDVDNPAVDVSTCESGPDTPGAGGLSQQGGYSSSSGLTEGAICESTQEAVQSPQIATRNAAQAAASAAKTAASAVAAAASAAAARSIRTSSSMSSRANGKIGRASCRERV